MDTLVLGPSVADFSQIIFRSALLAQPERMVADRTLRHSVFPLLALVRSEDQKPEQFEVTRGRAILNHSSVRILLRDSPFGVLIAR